MTLRHLNDDEIEQLLGQDVPARLATIDAASYPHVTPIWFVWTGEDFVMASDAGRPHLHRIEANPRVGLVIDVEEPERPDGQRPNRQVRVTGDATLSVDTNGAWSTKIWAKYRSGIPGPTEFADRLGGRRRILITVKPHRLIGRASV